MHQSRISNAHRTAETHLGQRIAAVRHFNRFYTRQIGLLREKPYQSLFVSD